MRQQGFSNIALITAIVVVAGVLGYLILIQRNSETVPAQEATSTPPVQAPIIDPTPPITEPDPIEPTPPTTQPERLVYEFYQGYLKVVNCTEEGCWEKSNEYLRLHNDLTESYKDLLLNEARDFHVDPILWAQDIPPIDNLQVEEAKIINGDVSVDVTFLPMWAEHKVRVSLRLVNDEWKITDIRDMRGRVGDIEFETVVLAAGNGSYNDKKNYVITNDDDWENLGQTAEIDFNSDIVIAAFQGEKASSGYAIEIKEILVTTENTVEVWVLEIIPGPTCITASVITSPYHIVKIPKTNKEIVFDMWEFVTDCGGPPSEPPQ
ncbi:MAG: protease complex subunit PrcB family protein [bacterium]|nr:protease complex subunit PrcB family protein [bacterium]